MQFTITTAYEAEYCHYYFFGAGFIVGRTYETDNFVHTPRQFLAWAHPGMDILEHLPVSEDLRRRVGIQTQEERRAARATGVAQKKKIERNLITPLPLPG